MKNDINDRLSYSEDVESPFLPASHDVGHQARKKPLTLLPLIALIFFEVSGGPFGTEDAVAAGGPLLVLAGFLIFPLIWSVPEALITAELATAFPENSGYVAWVTAAFGPFWGFQEGFWSWLSGVTDNSIYPVMFADNLRIFFPALSDGWPRMAFLVIVSLLLTYLNYRGLNVVGNTAMTTTIFIITPFVLLCALALPHAQPANWLQFDASKVRWGTYLSIMFWNLNYWDSISCLAGEVDNPSKTFPRALLWAVLLVVLSYFLPTLAALGVAVDTQDWQLGYYGKVAQQVGGNWLAWWIVLAAAASQIGQFQAEMSSDSYQLQGMAERGFLPKALARRSRHGTPTVGILLSSLGVVCLASFSFVDIVELLNSIYCLAELLEFAAFIWLRVRAPALPRAYRVPLPTWGLVLMLLPASLLLLAILLIPFWEGNFKMIAATTSALFGGFILYPVLSFLKEREWVQFSNLEFDYAHQTAGEARTYTIHASGGLNYDPTYNAEYVDVMHDGLTGVRTTGSSLDLGSSSRGLGSISGSLSGFSGLGQSFTTPGQPPRPIGTSPRSPIGPAGFRGIGARFLAGRSVSAPPAAAAASAAASPLEPSPEVAEEGLDQSPPAAAAGSGGGGGVPPPATPQPAGAAAPSGLSRLGPSAADSAARPATAPSAVAAVPAPAPADQPSYAPAFAAIAATVAAASRSNSRRNSDASSDNSRLGPQASNRDVSSFRVRLSIDSSGMGIVSEDQEHDGVADAPVVADAAAGRDASFSDLLDMESDH